MPSWTPHGCCNVARASKQLPADARAERRAPPLPPPPRYTAPAVSGFNATPRTRPPPPPAAQIARRARARPPEEPAAGGRRPARELARADALGNVPPRRPAVGRDAPPQRLPLRRDGRRLPRRPQLVVDPRQRGRDTGRGPLPWHGHEQPVRLLALPMRCGPSPRRRGSPPSANRIVSTDFVARGGKELSNVEIFDNQATARERS